MPKNRGHNYTEREKQDLIGIVDKYKHIVENKKTDSITTKQKNECWAQIAVEYNGCVDRPREIEQLKYCYTNIKRTKKKHCASERGKEYIEKRRKSTDLPMVSDLYNEIKNEAKEKNKQDKIESIKTGGGTYNPTFTETDSLILSVCPGQFEPLANIYDDAAVYFKDVSPEELTNNESNEEIIRGNLHLVTQHKITENETEEDLHEQNKMENSKNKTTRKKSSFKDELVNYTNQRKRKIEEETNWTKIYNEKKVELIDLQIKQSKEEHELKMKLLKLDLKLKEKQLNL